MTADSKIFKVYDVVLELVNKESNPLKITISEIADKCGIGKGTVYEYFKSKEDIFIKTFNYFITLVIKDIESIEGDNFKGLFYAYYDQLVRMQKKCNAAFLTIMLGDSRFIPSIEIENGIKEILVPMKKCMENFTKKLIIQGISEGVLSEKLEIDNIYFASMGIVSSIFASNSPIGNDIYIDKKLASADSCYKCYVKLLN